MTEQTNPSKQQSEVNPSNALRLKPKRRKPKSPLSCYGEPTKVMRIPETRMEAVREWLLEQIALERAELPNASEELKVYALEVRSELDLTLFSHRVVAGFPSPADDHVEDKIDLNTKFIKNPNTTFLVKVQGDSMKKAGIYQGDFLAVDRSLKPKDKDIVIASVDGELTVKRLSVKSTGTWLMPENDDYDPIAVRPESDLVIWGVVVSVLRDLV
jgi:DNA polymerase V